jgi:hypothetical protein
MFKYLFAGLLTVACYTHAGAWGFWAHARINRMATYSLAPEMFGFFSTHRDYLTAHATDPDKRRYAVKGEAPRHYIDLDSYGLDPDSMPRSWSQAIQMFGRDSLESHGMVPWHINLMHLRLTKAFESRDADAILKLAADLGHYVADACVPLHTTKNYNGQLTDQRGVHALWESRLPELFGEDYDYFIGPCQYIADPLGLAWQMVLSSHTCVDSVLSLETEATNKVGAEKKFVFTQRGASTVRTYSQKYCDTYRNLLHGMVERRFRYAIRCVANLWFSAWVNAGQPNLDGLKPSKKKIEIISKRLPERQHEH